MGILPLRLHMVFLLLSLSTSYKDLRHILLWPKFDTTFYLNYIFNAPYWNTLKWRGTKVSVLQYMETDSYSPWSAIRGLLSLKVKDIINQLPLVTVAAGGQLAWWVYKLGIEGWNPPTPPTGLLLLDGCWQIDGENVCWTPCFCCLLFVFCFYYCFSFFGPLHGCFLLLVPTLALSLLLFTWRGFL